jgi:DNA-binding NtrC family response regulator
MAEQLNILVIDDDPAMRTLLGEIIARGEHQVVPVASAEEGLKVLPFWTFQVAFIDQNLPGMEGLVMGEYLRGNNPDMTIALVTGDDDRKLQRRSRDLDIVFIRKPFDVKEILGVVGRYLEGAAERRERRLRREDAYFDPPLGEMRGEVAAAYDAPRVPERVSDRLAETIKRSLNNLRSVSRYNERDRVIALSGLMAADVLGIELPHADERTLHQEYDELMRQHGRRIEFDTPGDGAGEDGVDGGD